MKEKKSSVLLLLMALLLISACGDGSSPDIVPDNSQSVNDSGDNSPTGDNSTAASQDPASGDNTDNTQPSNVAITSLKLIRPDGAELDFTAKDFKLPVPVHVIIEAVFNKAIANKSAFEASFTLKDDAGKRVEGTFTWGADDTSVAFLHLKNLKSKTKYTIETSISNLIAAFTTMTPGDIDGDGIADLVVGTELGNDIYVYSSKTLSKHMDPATNPAYLAKITGEKSGDRFGFSVSANGDANGDGYADILVGAYSYGNGTGAAYLISGQNTKGDLTAKQAYATIVGNSLLPEYFGYAVSLGGDLNGDGFSEALVGTNSANADYDGAACLFDGALLHGDTIATNAKVIFTGEGAFTSFGSSVTISGDIDGDGYDDLLIGAFRNGKDRSGSAYLFSGKTVYDSKNTKIIADRALATLTQNTEKQFGRSISASSDVDGDGYVDVLVGTYGGINSYLYSGKSISDSNGTKNPIAAVADGNTFVYAVSIGGDISGDGVNDIAVGKVTTNGNAYLYSGAMLLDPNQASSAKMATFAGENPSDEFGQSVLASSDFNGDGVAELVVSSPSISNGQGMVYIYSGQNLRANANPDTGPKAMIQIRGGKDGEHFGRSISSGTLSK